MTFEQKVKAMTGKEILGAMIAGLQKRWVSVDMSTFGDVRDHTCFGCAATNTVCQINGKPFSPGNILNHRSDSVFLYFFEMAIDDLRRGALGDYNLTAASAGFAQLPYAPHPLPALINGTWRENLQAYIDFYNSLP